MWKAEFLELKVWVKLVWGSTADLPCSTRPWGKGPSHRYLDPVDVGPAHAAAPVEEEDELAVGLSQVRLD